MPQGRVHEACTRRPPVASVRDACAWFHSAEPAGRKNSKFPHNQASGMAARSMPRALQNWSQICRTMFSLPVRASSKPSCWWGSAVALFFFSWAFWWRVVSFFWFWGPKSKEVNYRIAVVHLLRPQHPNPPHTTKRHQNVHEIAHSRKICLTVSGRSLKASHTRRAPQKRGLIQN